MRSAGKARRASILASVSDEQRRQPGCTAGRMYRSVALTTLESIIAVYWQPLTIGKAPRKYPAIGSYNTILTLPIRLVTRSWSR